MPSQAKPARVDEPGLPEDLRNKLTGKRWWIITIPLAGRDPLTYREHAREHELRRALDRVIGPARYELRRLAQ